MRCLSKSLRGSPRSTLIPSSNWHLQTTRDLCTRPIMWRGSFRLRAQRKFRWLISATRLPSTRRWLSRDWRFSRIKRQRLVLEHAKPHSGSTNVRANWPPSSISRSFRRLGDASTLLVSPDGGLWLFPWEAMSIGSGRFLVEQKQIDYLVSGRSIVAAAPSASGNTAVLFADPDYNAMPSNGTSETLGDWVAYAQRPLGSGAKVGLLDGGGFQRSPDAKELVDSLTGSLKNYLKTAPVVYQGSAALEEKFKALHGPRILVLSTHGYFLREQLFDNMPETAAGQAATSQLNLARLFGLAPMPIVSEPLLRCGLAMTGANHHYMSHNANDGILTGLEVLGTDLLRHRTGRARRCESGVAQSATAKARPECNKLFSHGGAPK